MNRTQFLLRMPIVGWFYRKYAERIIKKAQERSYDLGFKPGDGWKWLEGELDKRKDNP